MFPFVYGFHWTPYHITFLCVFFTVVAAVVSQLLLAGYRSARDLKMGAAPRLRWHEEFEELSRDGRACRHQLTGEAPGRVCEREFACDACPDHPRYCVPMRAQARALDPAPYGMTYPCDRLYHRGHTWVQLQADGTALVGLDELGQRLIGSGGEASLPPVGTRITRDGAAWMVRRGADEVRVLAPVDGTVVATGAAGDGFVLRMNPLGAHFELRHLLAPTEVKPWLRHELERLQLMLAPDGVAPSLADGGVPVSDLPAACPTADWDAVWGALFLEP